jgi:hypothetical protein
MTDSIIPSLGANIWGAMTTDTESTVTDPTLNVSRRGEMRKLKARRTFLVLLSCVALLTAGCSGATEVSTDSTNPTAGGSTQFNFAEPSAQSGCPSDACSANLAEVAAGTKTDTIPPDVKPSLADASKDVKLPDGPTNCSPLPISAAAQQPGSEPCTFPTGAPDTAPLIVLMGNSQAWMWATTFFAIAKQLKYRFALAYHTGCHMPLVNWTISTDNASPAECLEWENAAVDWTNQQNAAAVLVASGPDHEDTLSSAAIATGYAALLKKMEAPGRKLFAMGEPPRLKQDAVYCLGAHSSSALKCGRPPADAVQDQKAPLDGAKQAGATYINVTPWFCTPDMCPAVIGNFLPYSNQFHITSTYGEHLTGVLQQVLGLAPAA